MTDWQRALSAQIAENVEHFREMRGLKRVDLANRCTALGLPTKRTALVALLDGHRQTVTVQELIVLAEALDTSIAELLLPLHTGRSAVSGPGRVEHPIVAAERMLGIDAGFSAARSDPYRPFVRLRRGASQFVRANARLAAISHRIATGDFGPTAVDGRPHPASELLAAEAALSRLVEAHRSLASHRQVPPPMGPEWAFLDDPAPLRELPVLHLLRDAGCSTLPIIVFTLHPDELPRGRLVTTI